MPGNKLSERTLFSMSGNSFCHKTTLKNALEVTTASYMRLNVINNTVAKCNKCKKKCKCITQTRPWLMIYLRFVVYFRDMCRSQSMAREWAIFKLNSCKVRKDDYDSNVSSLSALARSISSLRID